MGSRNWPLKQAIEERISVRRNTIQIIVNGIFRNNYHPVQCLNLKLRIKELEIVNPIYQN